VTGLREPAAEVNRWEERLRRAADRSSEGGGDSDVVHQFIANAELSQLKRHRKAVARLVALLPPKLRATYMVGASDAHQRFWVQLFTSLPRRPCVGRSLKAADDPGVARLRLVLLR
jgi:hypothetical protein